MLRGLAVVFVLVSLTATPFARPAGLRADELSDAYAKQAALQKQIEQQKALLASLKDAQAKTAAALKDSEAKLDEVNADLATVRAAVKEATAQLATATDRYYDLVGQVRLLHEQLLWLQAQEDQKAAELALRQDELARHLEAAYQDSHVPLLAQLLSAGSLNDVLVTISYNLTVGEQDRELAQRIADDQQTLAALEATTTQLRAQTVVLRDEAADQRAQLATQRAELQDAKAKLKELQDATEALVAAQEARYAELASDAEQAADLLAKQRQAEEDLQKLINRLVRERSGSWSIPSQYNGSLIWPMRGVVTQEFGCTGFVWEPPLGDCAHFHAGIDIANSSGTHIHAAGDGVVVYAGCGYDYYGACEVVVAHSSRLLSWYVHVQRSIPVRAGQHVSQGQLIAYEGCTGLCTGPHLHWGVELDDTWVNPRLFL